MCEKEYKRLREIGSTFLRGDRLNKLNKLGIDEARKGTKEYRRSTDWAEILLAVGITIDEFNAVDLKPKDEQSKDEQSPRIPPFVGSMTNEQLKEMEKDLFGKEFQSIFGAKK